MQLDPMNASPEQIKELGVIVGDFAGLNIQDITDLSLKAAIIKNFDNSLKALAMIAATPEGAKTIAAQGTVPDLIKLVMESKQIEIATDAMAVLAGLASNASDAAVSGPLMENGLVAKGLEALGMDTRKDQAFASKGHMAKGTSGAASSSSSGRGWSRQAVVRRSVR